MDDERRGFRVSWRVLREHAERCERPDGMTAADERVWLEYVEDAEEARHGYTEYDTETLFSRARCGIRPPRMSPRQSADYDTIIAELREHPEAELPLHVGDAAKALSGSRQSVPSARTPAADATEPLRAGESVVADDRTGPAHRRHAHRRGTRPYRSVVPSGRRRPVVTAGDL